MTATRLDPLYVADSLAHYTAQFDESALSPGNGWIGPDGRFYALPYRDECHGVMASKAGCMSLEHVMGSGFIRYRSGWHEGPSSNIDYVQPITRAQLEMIEVLHGDVDRGTFFVSKECETMAESWRQLKRLAR